MGRRRQYLRLQSVLLATKLSAIILVASTITSPVSFCWEGRGAATNASNFADNLSARAASIGPKTFLFNAALFALVELARAPFAMV